MTSALGAVIARARRQEIMAWQSFVLLPFVLMCICALVGAPLSAGVRTPDIWMLADALVILCSFGCIVGLITPRLVSSDLFVDHDKMVATPVPIADAWAISPEVAWLLSDLSVVTLARLVAGSMAFVVATILAWGLQGPVWASFVLCMEATMMMTVAYPRRRDWERVLQSVRS